MRQLTRDGFAFIKDADDWTARKAELESNNPCLTYIDEDMPVSYPCLALSITAIDDNDTDSLAWYHYFVYADEVAVLLQDIGLRTHLTAIPFIGANRRERSHQGAGSLPRASPATMRPING
jgi:hypothetical protein